MKKLLIANRGEIACRIIRTARAMGIATVAVYSEADADALHVRAADEAVPIGPAPARESYLLAEKLLEAARTTGADAIHPGYGFLSENADFADAVRAAGLIFVGPSGDSIRLMGLKDSAKSKMKAAGIPVTPGYAGEDQSLARLERMADLTGFPLLIKAVAGGGGKGMRPVAGKAQFTEALLAAKREAEAAFGNDSVLLEKLITRPRHVEVQIFGDAHGNIVHLFERDCSVQRRHQKVIEEAPAPGLSERLRTTLGIAAITAGIAIGYQNAGTVEFILDMDDADEQGDPKFYFMEMNTRLQVEHPVTEAITRLDLVEWQLRIARGEMLPLMQDAIECRGHAMEARLYAENAENGFLPSTGTITRLDFGPARIETGVAVGSDVTVHYDPMIAKIITHGATRDEARRKLIAALDATRVEGVTTNRGFLARLAAHPAFAAADLHTGFIDAHQDSLFAARPLPSALLATAAAHLVASAQPANASPFAQPFRLNLPAATHLGLWLADGTALPCRVAFDGARATVHLPDNSHLTLEDQSADGTPLWALPGEPPATLIALPDGVEMRADGYAWALFSHNPQWNHAHSSGPTDGSITAPMPGRIVSVHVSPGTEIAAGDRLLVLEAMKMEHRLTAPFNATVETVTATAGAQVTEGTPLVTLTRRD